MWIRGLVVFCAAFLSAPLTAWPASGSVASVPAFKHVLVIILENTDAADALNTPYLSALTRQGAYLDQFYAVTHPSQPNYIALTSGDRHGVVLDNTVNLDVRSIADLVEAKGKSWKAYAEDYPGGCFTGTSSGKYVRKHMPFMSYTGIQTDPKRCARIVNSREYFADAASGGLPDFAFYAPNLDNDGHDTNVDASAQWLSQTFGALFSDPKFLQDSLIAITFDESSYFGGNRIYAVLLGDHVAAGVKSEAHYDLYSLLRTFEAGLGLGTLGQNDDQATPITDVWKN